MQIDGAGYNDSIKQYFGPSHSQSGSDNSETTTHDGFPGDSSHAPHKRRRGERRAKEPREQIQEAQQERKKYLNKIIKALGKLEDESVFDTFPAEDIDAAYAAIGLEQKFDYGQEQAHPPSMDETVQNYRGSMPFIPSEFSGPVVRDERYRALAMPKYTDPANTLYPKVAHSNRQHEIPGPGNYEYTVEAYAGLDKYDGDFPVYAVLPLEYQQVIWDQITRVRALDPRYIAITLGEKLTPGRATRLIHYGMPSQVDKIIQELFPESKKRVFPGRSSWMDGLTHEQRREVLRRVAVVTLQSTDRLGLLFGAMGLKGKVADMILKAETKEEVWDIAQRNGLFAQRDPDELPWEMGLSVIQKRAVRQRLAENHYMHSKAQFFRVMSQERVPPGYGLMILNEADEFYVRQMERALTSIDGNPPLPLRGDVIYIPSIEHRRRSSHQAQDEDT
jgi:hypothetical protein